MPAFLLSATFWKFLGVFLLVVSITVAVSWFVAHYKNLEAQAALVPGLQKANASLASQAAANDKRASDLTGKLALAYAQRDQAVADYQQFQAQLGKFGSTLNGIAANANATKNPVCLPTDSERELFNATVASFQRPNAGAGQAATGSSVPASTH